MPAAPAVSSPRPPHILYAEDLRELRDVARMSLGREGYAIECVEDGKIALGKLTADLGACDLLITDHHMPNMNGLELVAQLRALPFAGKIMVFSSELSPAIADEYRRLSVDRILYKPVFPSELRQALVDLSFPPPTPRARPGDAAPGA